MKAVTLCRTSGTLALLAGFALHAAAVSAHDDHGVAAPTPAGGLSWDVLKSARAVDWQDAATSRSHLRPEFSPDILAYDAQEVKVAGYMMATDEETPSQSRFILFQYQPDCLLHMSMGPTGFIDVRVDQPAPVTDRPLVVQGRLRLVHEPKGGIFYRIDHAKVLTDI